MADKFVVTAQNVNIAGTYNKDSTYYINELKLAKIERTDLKYFLYTRTSTTNNSWAGIIRLEGSGTEYTGTLLATGGIVTGFKAKLQQAVTAAQPTADAAAITESRTAASRASERASNGQKTALTHLSAAQEFRRRVAIAKTAVDGAKSRVVTANKISAGVNAAATEVARKLTEVEGALRSVNDEYNKAVAASRDASLASGSASGSAVTASSARSYAENATREAVKAETAANAANTAKQSAERAALSADAEVVKAGAAATAAIGAASIDPSTELLGIRELAEGYSQRADVEKGRAHEYKTTASTARASAATSKSAVDVAKTEIPVGSFVVDTAQKIAIAALAEANIAVGIANSAYDRALVAANGAKNALLSANSASTDAIARSAANTAKQEADKAAIAAGEGMTGRDRAAAAAQNARDAALQAGAAVNAAKQTASRVAPPGNNVPSVVTSPTTLGCDDLAARLVGDLAAVECPTTAPNSSVIINGGGRNLTVMLHKRESGGWGGYETIGSQTTAGTRGSAKGLYVLIDTTGKIVTFVWNYHGNSAPEKFVYDVSLINATTRAYTLTEKPPTLGALVYSVTVVDHQPNPFYVPVQTEAGVDAAACTELKVALTSASASNVACAPTATPSSVIIKGSSGAGLTVLLYKRESGWGGYATIAQPALEEGAKGVYAMIDTTGKIVTLFWHYTAATKAPVKAVYDAKSLDATTKTYTLTQNDPVAAGAPTFSVTVGSRQANPFYEPTEVELDATACDALKRLALVGLVVCGPNSGDPSTVRIKRGAAEVQVMLYKNSGFWAGYSRASTASPGVYVKIQGKDDVTCVWEADPPATTATATPVAYKAARIITPGASPLRAVYTLATAQEGQTQVTTMEHTAGGSPFPAMTQEEVASAEDAEKSRSDACDELKKTMPAVRCDKTGTPTIVSIRRGTEALVNVSLYKDSSGSWAGYGLAPKVPAPPTKGVYVSIGGMGAKCVWDSGASLTQSIVEYKATQAGVGSSTYTLVPLLTTTTQVAETVVVVVVLAGASPFPPAPVASTLVPSSSSGWKPSTEEIVGIVVGGALGLLILIAVVFLILKRGKGN